ncbi:ABC transporter permease [Aneurinibacillus terranovensis]|uniref:ABC transporter permease n=1 Tax=Aneurinibacillus terranovensis TaxID=278991 RepID=UPI00047F8FA5|nr:ABC transporter permease [Aneurinibacillus terranovensis]
MMSPVELWKKRAGLFWKEALRYFRYIGNSGTLTFFGFAFIVGAYYYGQLLKWLPTDYPVEWGIAFVFSLILTISPVRTFLKEADLVFLLPVEWRMDGYFRHSLRYSFIFQAIYIVMVLLVLWPLYTHRMGPNAMPFYALLVFLLIIKGANLLAAWQEQRLREGRHITFHVIVRFAATLSVMLVLFCRGVYMEVAVLSLIYLGGGWLYYRLLGKRYVNWEQLLTAEKASLARFYHVVNWFVDVPGMETRIHNRPLFPSFVDRLAFEQKNTYTYLYGKTFVRSDLFGMVVRLTLVAFLLIWAIPGDVGKGIIYVLFLYMTGVQLSTLRQYHRDSFWGHIYPLRERFRKEALVKIIYRVMAAQTAVLFIVLLVTGMRIGPGLAALLIGFGISYGYSHKIFVKRL